MENTDSHQQHLNQVTLMGMLVAIGIVFGDIGTSPLYTFSAVIGSKPVEPLLALGLKKRIVKLEASDIRHHQMSNTRYQGRPHNSCKRAEDNMRIGPDPQEE
jgi:hypothetical protein